jgi:hypothetical protein
MPKVSSHFFEARIKLPPLGERMTPRAAVSELSSDPIIQAIRAPQIPVHKPSSAAKGAVAPEAGETSIPARAPCPVGASLLTSALVANALVVATHARSPRLCCAGQYKRRLGLDVLRGERPASLTDGDGPRKFLTEKQLLGRSPAAVAKAQ